MKLKYKVVLVNICIMIPVLLFISYIILKWVDNQNLYSVYRYLQSQEVFCRDYIDEYIKSGDNPQNVFTSQKIAIQDKLKKIVGVNIEVFVNHAGTPDDSLVKRSMEGKTVYLVASNEPVRTFSYVFPIQAKGSIIGVVKLKYLLYEADNIKRNLIILLVTMVSCGVLFSILLSYLLSVRIISPLEKLKILAQKISKGEFEVKTGIKTGDEIESLAKSFEEMAISIRNMIENLKEEQHKQKEFMDSVTHEIRAPLTNIMGFADLLEKDLDNRKKTEFIGFIKTEGARLLDMVNNLLDLSRIGKFDMKLSLQEVRLDRLISGVVELFEPRAVKFGYAFTLEMQPISVKIDPEKIKQVLMNVIDNAIKYSDGDHISIKIERAQTVTIHVSDNGKGISEKELSKITEPFYRIDKSRSRSLGGSGLGLAICKSIVDLHSGEMNIESREGQGTTVTISLHVEHKNVESS